MLKNMNFYRPTWVEINLSALAANYLTLKKRLLPETKIMAAVKANAYGHGIIEVSKKLAGCGIDYLGVACMDEAMLLRKNNIKIPILFLGVFFKNDIEAIVLNGITATVTDLNLAKKLDECARRLKKKVYVHIKIDTGMGRLGVWHDKADDFIIKVCALKNIHVEGLYTHFPSADSDEAFTRSQIAVFGTLIKRLEIKGVKIELKHLANSMAVFGFTDSYFNLVRPGLCLYGLHPKDDMLGAIDLKPVLSFKTKIAFLKDVERGRTISYGRTHIVKKNTKIASLPVGYGDGYNRLLSGCGHVLIRGERCPIVGRVCMDQIMVDVGHLKEVKVEDEVILIGSQDEKNIRVEDVAKLCGTIPYEVVCWISPRVPRVYLNK